jgi:hypothetical protein
MAKRYAVFETPSSPWQRVYGMVATAVVFALFMHLLMVAPGLSVAARIGYGLLIALNGITIGRLFAGQAGAIELEALRVVMVFGALAAGLWFTPVPGSVQVVAAFGMVLSLVLLARARGERADTVAALPGAQA